MPRNLLGIHEFADDDPENGVTISDTLNLLSTSVTESLTAWSGTAAERNVFDPPFDGALWKDTDGQRRRWIGSGGQWVPETAWAHQVSGPDSGPHTGPVPGVPPIFKTGYVKTNLVDSKHWVALATPFPNQILHVSMTPIEGLYTAPSVWSREISKDGFSAYWPGGGSSMVSFTYLAIGW